MPAIDGSALTGIVSIPSGLIAMWSGTNANIPSGWNLCDGNNGTPDLTDRFILGRAAGTNTGSTGGANTVTLATGNLPAHTHDQGNLATGGGGDHSHNFNANTGNSGNHTHNGYTSNNGNHNHYYVAGGNSKSIRTSANQSTLHYMSNAGGGANTGNNGAHSHNVATYGSGDHSHNFNANTGNSGNHTHNVSGNTGSVGSGTAVTTTPPYYTLAFIQKT